MFGRTFVFANAWYLLLLLLIPLIWWSARRSLTGLGKYRRWIALGLRTAVLALIVCALAGMQYEKSSDRFTVLYLLDQSLSVPESQRRSMIDFVNRSIEEHRRIDEGDRWGVIVFGRDAAVEIPPIEYDLPLLPNIESQLDREYTDLAGAMRRAQAMFTSDSAKRVVVVTDGNENLGDALRQARALTEAGVSIDVVPVPLAARSEISVEKITIPADVRRDQPFDLRVVLNHETANPRATRPIRGKLRIIKKTADTQEIMEFDGIELPPGKQVRSVRQVIDRADFYTYEAEFVPENRADDGTDRNNTATTFTQVRGRGHVLLIENFSDAGQFSTLVDRLRGEGLEVTVKPSNQLFSSLPELQRYDSVVLANVPRASGSSAEDIADFTDRQIEMLVKNTQLGCGLVMLGGADSFGAGGWTGTGIEGAMPVDFQIKSKKVRAVGALVLTMHAGEMPRANFWQRKIAIEAIKALGYQDWCGMVQWNGTDSWMWNQSRHGMWQVGPRRANMLRRVDRMQIGDMPSFEPSMMMAVKAFAALDADPNAKPAVKHMIIISDGDPDPPKQSTVQQLAKLGVKVTTVAVPSHGTIGSQVMNNIATATGGKYYVVRSGRALPRIYQREIRKVAQPLIYEPGRDLFLQRTMQHEMIKGIDAFPPIRGFVMTTVKDGVLPEVALISPEPADPRNATILAGWVHGLGKAVAVTTDAGQRWAEGWEAWEGYDRFYSQVIRWSMRPLGDTGNYTVSTDVRDGKTRVIITALDQDEELLNYQAMSGMVVGPDMKMNELRIEQVAPGRYVGEFDSEMAGSYSISMLPGAGQGQILTGVNVGYSDEYRDRETNMPLLSAMAELPAKDAEAGILSDGLTGPNAIPKLVESDPFRRDLPKAKAVQDIWPLLILLCGGVFLADVFVRRVQVGFEWLAPVAARAKDWVLRREPEAKQVETMSRLRSRKAEVDQTLQKRRAATRFEPTPEAPVDPTVLEEASSAAPPRPKKAAPKAGDLAAEAEQDDDYTSRLLQAKKKVWRDRQQ